MKILMIINSFRPLVGGTEVQAERLSRELVCMGHSVKILTRNNGNAKAREVSGGVDIRRLKFINLPQLPFIAPLSFLINVVRFVLSRRKDIDIIHTHQLSTAIAGGICSMLFGMPLITKIGGGKTNYGSAIKGVARKPLGRFRVAFLKRYVRRFVALNPLIYKDLVDEGIESSNILNIPNGVDTEKFAPSSKKEKEELKKEYGLDGFSLLYAGRLIPVKGIDILLDAWKEVKGELDATLVVAGEGKEDIDGVKFLGKCDYVDKLMKAVDCFVIPSRFEGMSNALLEAMASGLAIIASDVEGNKNIIEHGKTGILVPVENGEKLASAIRKLASDPILGKELGKSARETCLEKYSLKAVAVSYENAYKALLKE